MQVLNFFFFKQTVHQHGNGSNVVFNKKVFIFLLNYAFILLVLIVSYICLSFFH